MAETDSRNAFSSDASSFSPSDASSFFAVGTRRPSSRRFPRGEAILSLDGGGERDVHRRVVRAKLGQLRRRRGVSFVEYSAGTRAATGFRRAREFRERGARRRRAVDGSRSAPFEIALAISEAALFDLAHVPRTRGADERVEGKRDGAAAHDGTRHVPLPAETRKRDGRELSSVEETSEDDVRFAEMVGERRQMVGCDARRS